MTEKQPEAPSTEQRVVSKPKEGFCCFFARSVSRERRRGLSISHAFGTSLFRRGRNSASKVRLVRRPSRNRTSLARIVTDSETGMLTGVPGSAMCVQRFDDSLNSAIHTTYRISLRSSSLREPRDPLSKVVFKFNL